MVQGEHSWFKVGIHGSSWPAVTPGVGIHPQGWYLRIIYCLAAKGLLPDAGVCQDPLCPVTW